MSSRSRTHSCHRHEAQLIPVRGMTVIQRGICASGPPRVSCHDSESDSPSVQANPPLRADSSGRRFKIQGIIPPVNTQKEHNIHVKDIPMPPGPNRTTLINRLRLKGLPETRLLKGTSSLPLDRIHDRDGGANSLRPCLLYSAEVPCDYHSFPGWKVSSCFTFFFNSLRSDDFITCASASHVLEFAL